MDFHHLKYFVEVADKKSFSKAARTLHISQSAISRTIKALEEELGVVLFMRNAKAVELTDAGTIFLSHAKRVVFMFEHLKTDFENEFKLEQGTVLIGLPPITGAPIFANLLGAFKQEYPQIELDLYEHGSKKVEISVQEGLIDLGIVCTQPKEKDFESFFLTQDPMNVIIHRDNILSKEKTIPLKKLANESLEENRFPAEDRLRNEPAGPHDPDRRRQPGRRPPAEPPVPDEGNEPPRIGIGRRPSPGRTGNHARPLRHLETGPLPLPCRPVVARLRPQ